jgi:hypothetical protein
MCFAMSAAHLHRTPGRKPGRCAFGAVQVWLFLATRVAKVVDGGLMPRRLMAAGPFGIPSEPFRDDVLRESRLP